MMNIAFPIFASIAVLGSLGWCPVAAADLPATLVYSGLTENGWQIFAMSPSDPQPRQLTSTPGDKRRPQVAGDGQVLFKDANGGIGVVENGKERALLPELDGVGDFTGNTVHGPIYYTRLATNNPQRQFIWKQTIAPSDEVTSLVARMPKGSLRQVMLSADGAKILATHLYRVGEERIILFSADAAPLESGQYLSPEARMAFAPAWDPSNADKVYFSMEEASGEYDLYSASLSTGELHKILNAPHTSEWFPAVDETGRWLAFERRGDSGAELWVLDLEGDGKPQRIALPHPAREPVWMMQGGGS